MATVLSEATMPLVQIHGVDEVRVDTVPQPTCGADDVIIRVANCGICGSDLGYIAMGGLLGPGVPMPLGHELSGEVIECGAAVSEAGNISLGQQVVVNPEANGNRIGNSGPEGGFAPLLLVRGVSKAPEAVLPIPAHFSAEQGALVEPLSVSMHAVHQGRAGPGDKVVIFGAGPIGLGAVMVLRYYGVSDVAVVDVNPERLAQAAALGAVAINSAEQDVAEALIAAHGAAEFFGMPIPASSVYIEATGVGAVFEQIAQLAATAARIVVLGVHKAPVSLDLVSVLVKELEIIGSMAYPSEFPQVIEMLASGKVEAERLISHRFPLSEFHEALKTAQSEPSAMKVMVDCQA